MQKRYFEYVAGTSAKFWQIWPQGTAVHTRYGRIGSDGQTTVKKAGSAAAARELAARLVAEKTKKGYRTARAAKRSQSAATAPKRGKPSAAKPKNAGKALAPARAPAKRSRAAGSFAQEVAQIAKAAKAAGVQLRPGVAAKWIDRLESKLGCRLPAEVRAFYLKCDGAEGSGALNGERELLSIERITNEWIVWKKLLDEGTFEANDHGVPGKGIQKKWWIPEWVPVSYDGCGNHHVIDLAPAKGGTVGQVVSFWHDEASRTPVAKSFLAWLKKVKWRAEPED